MIKNLGLVLFFSLNVFALSACNEQYDGKLSLNGTVQLTNEDGSAVNVSVDQDASIVLTDKNQNGFYAEKLVLNGQKFDFLVAKQDFDPSHNHAVANATTSGQGIGLDATVTRNIPTKTETENVSEHCSVTAQCWNIISKTVTDPSSGNMVTVYDWSFGYSASCPGNDVAKVEHDYFADRLDVNFTNSQKAQVATFQGWANPSESSTTLSTTSCAGEAEFMNYSFKPNYVPTGPTDYRY